MQLLATSTLVVAAAAGIHAHAAQNETRALQSGPVCLAPEYHFDFPGGDLANLPGKFEDCCDACSIVRDCGAFTWSNYNGGTCWLKAYKTQSEWKGANTDGSANTISAEINRCGTITKDQDLVGIEGGSFRARRPENCCMPCFSYHGCKGFSWSDYNGGTCWLKGGDIQKVYKPGVYSVVYG